jgi:hypothetical protein
VAKAAPKSRKPKSDSPAQLTLVVGKTRPQWAAEINELYDRTIADY